MYSGKSTVKHSILLATTIQVPMQNVPDFAADEVEESTDAGSSSEADSSSSSCGEGDYCGMAGIRPMMGKRLCRRPDMNSSIHRRSPLATYGPPGLSLPGASPPPGLSHPNSARSKQGAHEGILAKAQREGLPLKLRLPSHTKMAFLDATLPAKKKLPYPEFDTNKNMITGLDPSLPIKRHIPDFLLEELPVPVVFSVLPR